jgi:predicted dehydrogenase/aryl-alcohol dehydrogenase-like predicted oxidoreductase
MPAFSTGNQALKKRGHGTMKLRWGILGTGMIAKIVAPQIRASATGELLAVGSRSGATAEAFGAQFEVPRRYGSYEELLADKDVDAVYLTLPNHLHAEWTLRCADAGKHILCEKPFASNHAEAMAVLDAVRGKGVFLMEAFMYRCHPHTAKIVELVKSRAIGDVRLIDSSFAFNFGEQPDNVRSKASMSGGGIMDVGCYPVSLARLIAGAALGLDGPAEPVEMRGVGHVHPAGGVDTWAVACMKFSGDILARVAGGLQLSVGGPAVVYGSNGRIVIHNPWFPGQDEASTRIEVHVGGKPEPEIHAAPGYAALYTIEVDLVAKHLRDRQAPAPAMTWADTLGNMRALDLWRRWIGVTFDCEKPEGFKTTVLARRPKLPKKPTMPVGQIEGVSKPVSRIIMGTMQHVAGTLPKACAILDRYVEAGGNALDLGWIYNTERVIGQWLKLRRLRDRLVLITKGGHSKQCTPTLLTENLFQSLDWLQTDHVDVFLMHRDNPKVPVGEFVDVLNRHLRAGRIKAFGGSNWTAARIQAANAYARRHKLRGFTASSPHFSLAAWNEPMWQDCTGACDPKSRAWYERTQLPLLAWSSQANGFFAGRFRPEDRTNPAMKEIVRVWFNDGNFERLRRAAELARDKGVTGNQVALAYVLGQPLNVFPIIGPDTLDELRDSLGALNVRLRPEEIAWLNLERAARP